VLVKRVVRTVTSSGVLRSTRPALRTEGEAMSAQVGGGMSDTVNGRQVVITGGSDVTITASSGERLANLTAPENGCQPLRRWSEVSLLVSCSSGIWLLPLDGSAPTRLAQYLPAGQGGGYGLADVYRVSGQLYGWEQPSCGSVWALARIGADQQPHLLPPHVGKLPIYGSPLAVTDNAFYYVVSTGGCSAAKTSTLYRYAPAQHAVTVLLGGTAGGGTVISAKTIGDPAS
jgi:hypothetical protein